MFLSLLLKQNIIDPESNVLRDFLPFVLTANVMGPTLEFFEIFPTAVVFIGIKSFLY